MVLALLENKYYLMFEVVNFLLFISGLIVYILYFVPWKYAFKDGFFDSPEYTQKQADLKESYPDLWKWYTGNVYYYVSFLIFQVSLEVLPSKHPIKYVYNQIADTVKNMKK